MSDRRRLQPLDWAVVPRYADVATFMRIPRIDELEDVDIGIFGIPLDAATYRGRTGRGRRLSGRPPAASVASTPVRASVHSTSRMLPTSETRRSTSWTIPGSLASARDFVAKVRAAGVRPVGVGGDHSATLPMLRGLYDGTPVGVLQFDAHADIQDIFFGTPRTTTRASCGARTKSRRSMPRASSLKGFRGNVLWRRRHSVRPRCRLHRHHLRRL